MRTTYRWCTICGGSLHEVLNWPDNCRPEYNYAKSDLPAPAIITDTLPGGVNGLYHHAERAKTDSKSEYRRWTRKNGCVELGNDRPDMQKREEVQLARDVVESAVNESLHQAGISSDCDARGANLVI